MLDEQSKDGASNTALVAQLQAEIQVSEQSMLVLSCCLFLAVCGKGKGKRRFV